MVEFEWKTVCVVVSEWKEGYTVEVEWKKVCVVKVEWNVGCVVEVVKWKESWENVAQNDFLSF